MPFNMFKIHFGLLLSLRFRVLAKRAEFYLYARIGTLKEITPYAKMMCTNAINQAISN